MMIQLLTLLLVTPVIGLIGCIITPKLRERTIFSIAFGALFVEFLILVSLATTWAVNGFESISVNLGQLQISPHYVFSASLYFDHLSLVFIAMATLMIGLVFIFSKYYMHREPGFKRFYYTVLLFFTGLSSIILAGNFETLLIGWELIGISSVLLIAFYRDRFLPARNALKVFSVYRIADTFLLAAIWYAHHIFEDGLHFAEISLLAAHHGDQLAILGLLLFCAALVKSAGFPFSYWLPRAMEGPTSSSAIFYGALSVHMGLFLLLRTYPLWEGTLWLQIVIAISGLVTAITASSIARVQSSIKTQIAYASIAQIGIMFIAVAIGLPWLALIHFVCNALLRTYQLLISPSVVGYLVHDQFFYFTPPAQRINQTLLGKIHATFYVLGVKEWGMNTTITDYLWRPLKSAGRAIRFLDNALIQLLFLVAFLILTYTASSTAIPARLSLVASTGIGAVAVVLLVRAYATKSRAAVSWNLTMLANLYCVLFLSLATAWSWKYILLYIIGVAAAFVAGHACFAYLESKGESTRLNGYHGSIYPHKELGHVVLIICLLLMAFPISSSFLAQEALLGQIPTAHAFQVVLFGLYYLLTGISVMRIYTKVFFGPHKTNRQQFAYKSS